MKFLITGGAGFIGSNFIHYILREDSERNMTVINLDKLTYAGNLDNLKDVENDPRYRFVKGSITDAKQVDALVALVDVVVNFAAESHVDRSIMDASPFIDTNIVGTYVLLEAIRRHGKRFHHVSTDEVFGALEKNEAPFDEKTAYDPKSPYSASKASADHLVRAYHHTYKAATTISNCSNNYGPYHFPEKFIPLAITNLLEGKKIPLYGDGKQVRDWLYVEDHCRALDLIVHQGKLGETYCIGGNAERENLWIAKKLLSLLGKNEDSLEYIQDRPGHDVRYAINFSKLENELGWRPQEDLETGLTKTVKWFEAHREWWQQVKSGVYQEYYKKQYTKE